MMIAILTMSSTPSSNLPNFNWADLIVKKGGHMLGYGLLSLAYLRGLGWKNQHLWLAWLLAVMYAVTDETYQSFIPGRHDSAWDVIIDSIGAAIPLFIIYQAKKKQDQL